MKIRKEIRIGIIGIIALIMLFFGLNFLKGINMFKPVNHFYVAFDDVAGIALSSPVFANGYQIGTVRNISFDYKRMDRVIVEVKTEKKMNIPKGSYAELVTEMLGTVKMNVLLKANNTKEFYAPGDTIQGKANKGLTALASDELLPRLKMTMDKVDSLLNNLNTILSDPALSSTLKNTQQITANLDVTTRKLNIMMEKDIPNITNRLSTITDNFTTISDNLKGIDYAQTLQKHKMDGAAHPPARHPGLPCGQGCDRGAAQASGLLRRAHHHRLYPAHRRGGLCPHPPRGF